MVLNACTWALCVEDPVVDDDTPRCITMVQDSLGGFSRRCRVARLPGLPWCVCHAFVLEHLIITWQEFAPCPDRFLGVACHSIWKAEKFGQCSSSTQASIHAAKVLALFVPRHTRKQGLMQHLAVHARQLLAYLWLGSYIVDRFLKDPGLEVLDPSLFTARCLFHRLEIAESVLHACLAIMNAFSDPTLFMGRLPSGMADMDAAHRASPVAASVAMMQDATLVASVHTGDVLARKMEALGYVLECSGMWLMVPIPAKYCRRVLNMDPVGEDHVDGCPAVAMFVLQIIPGVFVRFLVSGEQVCRLVYEANTFVVEWEVLLGSGGALLCSSWVPLVQSLFMEDTVELLSSAVMGAHWQCDRVAQGLRGDTILRIVEAKKAGDERLVRLCNVPQPLLLVRDAVRTVLESRKDFACPALVLCTESTGQPAAKNDSGVPCLNKPVHCAVAVLVAYMTIGASLANQQEDLRRLQPMFFTMKKDGDVHAFCPVAEPPVASTAASLPCVICFAI
jgi:hypothetical protein